jgi:hypothetical protein
MAELSEAEKKVILGENYRRPDPNAPKADIPGSAVRRIWAALTRRPVRR